MGHRRTNHRPLRAGIGVTPNRGIPGYGTLTGIARRNSDGALVAVTNLHVVSDGVDGNGNPSTYYVDEQDSLHQWDAAQNGSRIGNLYADTENGPVTSFIPVGGPTASLGDVAAVELATGVSATFDVHVHEPGTSNHRQVPIVAGTIDPVYVPVPEPWEREYLTLFAANTGEQVVEVIYHHHPVNFRLRASDGRQYSFQNVFRLDRSDPPSQPGDSGAPLLKMDEYGNFRMSAIYFASKPRLNEASHKWGYCFPASVAERELGLTFGTLMPTADAGENLYVASGGIIELNGSGSRSNETGGDPLAYTWVLENATGGVNPATYNPLLTRLPPHSARMSLSAPNKPAFLTFKLTVTDRFGAKHSDTATVKVLESSKKVLPTNVSARPGYRSVDISWNSVSLATGYEVQVGVAEDGGEIGYKSYTTTASPHRVENLADGTRYYYRVRMTNADGVGPWSAVASTVTAVPANHVPVANAGADQTVDAGASVTLDGSGSSDRDGDDLTYAWKQTKGTKVTLSGADTVRATFTAPSSAATLRFRLTVTDEHGMKAINAVIITVTAPTTEPTPEPTPEAPTTPEVTPPTGINATATANSVTVSWKAVSGATGYILQLGELGEDEMVGYADYTTTKLTHTVSNLKSGVRYYYRVKSKKAEVVSSPSAEASLVTPAMIYEDTGETRNEVNGNWTDTGRVQQDPVDDSWEKEQTRTVTWEKEQRCTNCAAGTPNKWVDASRTETRWVAYTPPPKHVWTWVDPAEYTGCGPTRKRRKECSNGHARHTKLVSASEPLIWSEWSDTGDTRDSDIDSWSDDGNTRGCGPDKEKRQSRTISREKKQKSTNQCGGSKTQWVPTTSRTETQWVDAPEDLIWDDWKNVGQPVIVYGSWTNVGSPSLIAGTCKQRQKRTWTRSQRQESTNQCGGTRFNSVTSEGTTYRYDTVTETWGSWTDTGRTREDPITFIVEYEQERFSSPCNRRQTRWEPETG